MTRYYISANNEKGFEEITKEEFDAIVGEPPVRGYASDVYRGTLAIDDVPEEYREAVISVVDAKVARWGKYDEQDIPASELKKMVEEIV